MSVANILEIARKATPEQWESGIQWYPRFRVDAMNEASKVGFIADTGKRMKILCGVVAAFSPQRNPAHNLHIMRCFFEGKPYTSRGIYHTGIQDRKASMIRDGCDPLVILTGPKERSFYNNVLGNRHYVTIDSHAYNIWKGVYITTDKSKVPRSIKILESCKADYMTAARELGLCPAECQAITWLVWRDMHQSDRARRLINSIQMELTASI